MSGHRYRRGGGLGTVKGAVSTALLLVACARPEQPRVGVVLGAEGVRAAKLAVEALNSHGGRPIGLRALSDAFGASAQIALQGAESLATDGTVLGVVGHTNSSASLAASQVYNVRRVVQIAPTTTSPLYSQAGPYSYRLTASDEYQAQFLADHVPALQSQRIAIVYVNDDYGRSLRRLIVEELAKRGVAPIYQGPYAESELDGSELVHVLAGTKPTVLLWLGRDVFFLRVADQLRAAAPNLPVLASDGFASATVQQNRERRFDGVRYVRLVNVDSGSPALQALRKRYRRDGGGEITDQAILAYDAVLLLGTAIREAGPDREAIRGWLDQLGRSRPPFVGVTGPISFSPDGDRAPTYALVTAGTGRRPSAGK